MFVVFSMEGFDDGKNRVGGNLLLLIFNTMREHGFAIPFPQCEVRVLDPGFNIGPLHKQERERAWDKPATGGRNHRNLHDFAERP